MEAGEDEKDGNRVMYVEDQLVVSSVTNNSATTNKAATNAAVSDSDKTADTAVDEESKEEVPAESDAEAQRLKANWTKQFLEHQGWNYIVDSFLAKDINSDVATTFME